MPGHYESWQATADRYGLAFDEARFYALAGKPTEDILRLLADEAGVTMDAAAVGEEKEQLFIDLGLPKVRPIGPVVEVVRRFHGRMPLAVATSAFRWVAKKTLAQIGMADDFAHLVTTEDVEHGKPAPDIYLHTAKLLNVDPARCVVYEDGQSGIDSARAAGMTVIDVKQMSGYPLPAALQR
jgi:HAD superfamily hydrolase (TIGR01509 family)